MKIAVKNNQVKTNFAAAAKPAVAQTKAEEVKSDADSMVDTIVDNTYLSANYAASGLSGIISGAGAFVTAGVPETVKAAGSALKNLYKAETIGPTIKTIGLAAAVPIAVVGGVVAAPVSLVMGLVKGIGEVDSGTPRQFTIGEATSKAYDGVNSSLSEFGEDIRTGLAEFGDEKLEPGEKPFDIPLFKLAKTVAMGAAGAIVGGAAGIASMAGSMVTETAKGVTSSLTSDKLNIAEKAFSAGTSVIGAAGHSVSFGVRTALGTFANSLENTWDNDSLTAGAKGIIKDAAEGVAVSVAPRTTLLEEKSA